MSRGTVIDRIIDVAVKALASLASLDSSSDIDMDMIKSEKAMAFEKILEVIESEGLQTFR